MPRKYICPGCKAKEGVNIEYGMPSYEAFEASQRGEIALGGCVIGENDPERRCLKCGHEWHIKRRLSLASDNLLDAPPPPQGWMMCVYASEENQAAADKSRRKHNLKVLRHGLHLVQ